MKRILSVFFALCLLLPFCVWAEGKTKRFYVQTEETGNGTYRADICWEGATQDDGITSFRLQLTYPEEMLVCTSNKIGEALRDFSIRMGPQYAHSNPAIFLGVNVAQPVDNEGVLGTLYFTAAQGAVGEAKLKLEVLELYDADGKDAKSKFRTESASLFLGGASGEPACEKQPLLHNDLPWQADAENAGVLRQVCPHCKEVVGEKTVQTAGKEPVTDGGVQFSPSGAELPEGTTIRTEQQQDPLEFGELSQIGEKLETKEPNHVGSLVVELEWEGNSLTLTQEGELTVPAPEGVSDGDTVYVVAVDENGEMQTHTVVAKDGKLVFSTRVFGTLHFFLGNTAPDEGTNGAEEEEVPVPTTLPAGVWLCLGVGVVSMILALVFVVFKKRNTTEK